MKKTLLFTLAILFSLASFCYALETDTHEDINEYIARNTINGFSLDSYLKDQLAIQGGIEESYDSKEIWKWMREGGRYEDKPPWCIPYWRSLRHFHNPLTDKGLDGIPESSIQWSQKPAETQSCGHYSWHDVRGYFLKALTSQTKSDKDENFAETFRGIGQLMHLVHDLSVPAHTRDDVHLFYNYERWVIRHHEKISEYDPIPFDPSAIGNPNPLAPVPVANLFDTNQYVGLNPDPSVTLRADIGLSEYTNANFFSNGTIFGTILSGNFPYPNWTSVQTEDYEIQDPRDPSNMVFRRYYKKVTHGDTGYRLATVPFLVDYVIDEPIYTPASLDKYVYNDYAERLIPRAVGYSAGLLDYFFRGKLDVEFVDEGLKITNKSEKTMDGGYFELYYDNEEGNRQQLDIYSGAKVTALQPDGEQTITFDPPSDFGEDEHYILVYRGALGNETNAVVGKVVVDGIGFVYVTVGHSGYTERCIVWDVAENDFAEIKDNDGNIISFPCFKDDISDWLESTTSLGKSYLWSSREVTYGYYPIYLCPDYSAYFQYNDCSKVYQRCSGFEGSCPPCDVFCIESEETSCSVASTCNGCADNTKYHFHEADMNCMGDYLEQRNVGSEYMPAIHYNRSSPLQSYNYYSLTNVSGNSHFRTKYSTNYQGIIADGSGSFCTNTNELKQDWDCSYISPIGTVLNWKNSYHSTGSELFGQPVVESGTKFSWYDFKIIRRHYFSQFAKAMVQIYFSQIGIISYPDEAISHYEWGIVGACDHYDAPQDQDPTAQNKNAKFTSALIQLVSTMNPESISFKNNGVSLSVDFRK